MIDGSNRVGTHWRHAARWLAAFGAGRLGLVRSYARNRRASGRWGIILRYHRIIPAAEPPSDYRMGIPEDFFATQMAWLAAHHRVVPYEEILRGLEERRTPPEDVVALTFDDGYLDNRTRAAPILERFRLPATFFVSTACLSERMPFWPETLAQALRLSSATAVTLTLEGVESTWDLSSARTRRISCLRLISRLRKLSTEKIQRAMRQVLEQLGVDEARAREAAPQVMKAEDVRALAAAGFTIGSHTVTHPYLSSESLEVQEREIEDSRRRLEEVIGAPIEHFCYPGGGYQAATVELVRRAGYRSAVSTDFGIAGIGDDLLLLPRIGVGIGLASAPGGRFSGELMNAEITGYLSARFRGRRPAPVTT